MAIYFDSGTGRGIGVEVRVTNESGESILKEIIPTHLINTYGNFKVPKEDATNNFGELLACYTALKIALKREENLIYGDSNLVLEYWSQGKYNKKNLKNLDTIKLIGEVKKLREAFERKGGKLLKVKGDFNPADLGFHK